MRVITSRGLEIVLGGWAFCCGWCELWWGVTGVGKGSVVFGSMICYYGRAYSFRGEALVPSLTTFIITAQFRY